jgi:hypothetical protein
MRGPFRTSPEREGAPLRPSERLASSPKLGRPLPTAHYFPVDLAFGAPA